MIKDILTTEIIKSDYKKEFRSSIKIVIILSIVFVLLSLLIIYLFSHLKNTLLFLEILMLSPAMVFAFICLAVIFDSYKDYITINREQFKIVTDEIIGYQEKETYISSPFLSSFSHPYILEFKSYGNYWIPARENYTKSRNYSLTDKDVFNYTTVGDTFYLVIIKKRKILLVYNTKLFEFKENI